MKKKIFWSIPIFFVLISLPLSSDFQYETISISEHGEGALVSYVKITENETHLRRDESWFIVKKTWETPLNKRFSAIEDKKTGKIITYEISEVKQDETPDIPFDSILKDMEKKNKLKKNTYIFNFKDKQVLIINHLIKEYLKTSTSMYSKYIEKKMKSFDYLAEMKKKAKVVDVKCSNELKKIDGRNTYKVIYNIYNVFKVHSWNCKEINYPKNFYIRSLKSSFSKSILQKIFKNPEFNKVAGFPIEINVYTLGKVYVSRSINFKETTDSTEDFKVGLSGYKELKKMKKRKIFKWISQ